MMRTIMTQKDLAEIDTAYLSRQQNIKIQKKYVTPFPNASSLIKKRKPTRYLRYPSISLSLLDNLIWLNECQCLNIPSIQLCDTQSFFDKIIYPIISNQRSIAFSLFLTHLAVEVGNSSLLSPHLEFLSFFKYAGHRYKEMCSYLNQTKEIPFKFHAADIPRQNQNAYRNWCKDNMPEFLPSFVDKPEQVHPLLRGWISVKREEKKKKKRPFVFSKRTIILINDLLLINSRCH